MLAEMFPGNARLSVRVILLPGISLCCQHPGIFFQGGFFPPKMCQSHTSAPVLEKDFSSSSGGCDHPIHVFTNKVCRMNPCPNSGNFQAACCGCTGTTFNSYSSSYNILVCLFNIPFYYYFNRGMGPGSSECWRMEQHPHSKLYQHGWSLTQRDETQEPFPQS